MWREGSFLATSGSGNNRREVPEVSGAVSLERFNA
jgi:hypothetical protein